jgi:hypothetical protein
MGGASKAESQGENTKKKIRRETQQKGKSRTALAKGVEEEGGAEELVCRRVAPVPKRVHCLSSREMRQKHESR